MWEFLTFVLTIVVWGVLWAAAAALATAASIIVSTFLERRFLVPERWTYPLWVVGLALCPAAAFVGSWTLCGLVLPERFYRSVRIGGLAAGLAFAVIGVLVVVKGRNGEDTASEVTTLLASLLTDVLCCAALIWHFEPVAAFMRSLGG